MSYRFLNRWAKTTKTLRQGYRQCFKKSSYKTEDRAKLYAEKAMEKTGQTLRVYHCNICKEYHLTHKGNRK